MWPNIEPCGIPDKNIENHSQYHLYLHPVSHVLRMNAQKLLHPLRIHIHDFCTK